MRYHKNSTPPPLSSVFRGLLWHGAVPFCCLLLGMETFWWPCVPCDTKKPWSPQPDILLLAQWRQIAPFGYLLIRRFVGTRYAYLSNGICVWASCNLPAFKRMQDPSQPSRAITNVYFCIASLNLQRSTRLSAVNFPFWGSGDIEPDYDGRREGGVGPVGRKAHPSVAACQGDAHTVQQLAL